MTLSPRKCPCGCNKVILEPLCGCQCSSVTPEEANELIVKVNRHDDLVAALEALVLNPSVVRNHGLVKLGADVLAKVKAELAAKPTFPEYTWAKR